MLQFQKELTALRSKGGLRECKFISSGCSAYIKINRGKFLNLCSNNYLGLADDKRLKGAAIQAVRKFGVGAGASRLVLGGNTLHKQLEKALANFKGQEAALVYSSGYSANLGIIPALVGRGDLVFSDRLNHASIIDGIILSRAELVRYPHKDTRALEELLMAHKPEDRSQNRLIITDSVFSMDGDIAPIPQLVNLAKKYDCLLMIDEAHATGVLGKDGSGVLEYFGIKRDKRIIQMGTLSKAIGALGGFVCGRKDLIDYLINRSRTFIFSTALPAGLCAGAIKAINIIKKDGPLRRRLWDNADFLRKGLQSLGFDTLQSQTPIIPVLTGEPKPTMEFSRGLFKEGIFVQGIRPPSVPEGASRLRVTVMATHTISDLKFALEKFKKIGKKLGII
jgi:8-amino-7-oxononanoate synthase